MRFLSRLSLFGVRLATVLLIVYWLLIFTGTHLPKLPVVHVPGNDKLYHFAAFVGLAFLLAWAIPTRGRDPRTKVVLALLVAMLYGVFDELTQALVPGRTSDIVDFAADCSGALLGVLCYWTARRVLVGSWGPPGGLRVAKDASSTAVQKRSAA